MSKQRHIIARQIFDLTLSNSTDGYALQERFSRLYWQQIAPRIGELFDELIDPAALVRIEKLELDFGDIDAANLEARLPDLFLDQLRQQLESLLREPSREISRQPLSLSQFESWLHFLEKGYLPWQSNALPLAQLQRAVLESVAGEISAVDRLRQLLSRLPHTLDRLVFQHPESFLQLLAEAMSGGKQGRLPELCEELQRICRSPASAGATRSSAVDSSLSASRVRHRFWKIVFERLAVRDHRLLAREFLLRFLSQQVSGEQAPRVLREWRSYLARPTPNYPLLSGILREPDTDRERVSETPHQTIAPERADTRSSTDGVGERSATDRKDRTIADGEEKVPDHRSTDDPIADIGTREEQSDSVPAGEEPNSAPATAGEEPEVSLQPKDRTRQEKQELQPEASTTKEETEGPMASDGPIEQDDTDRQEAPKTELDSKKELLGQEAREQSDEKDALQTVASASDRTDIQKRDEADSRGTSEVPPGTTDDKEQVSKKEETDEGTGDSDEASGSAEPPALGEQQDDIPESGEESGAISTPEGKTKSTDKEEKDTATAYRREDLAAESPATERSTPDSSAAGPEEPLVSPDGRPSPDARKEQADPQDAPGEVAEEPPNEPLTGDSSPAAEPSRSGDEPTIEPESLPTKTTEDEEQVATERRDPEQPAEPTPAGDEPITSRTVEGNNRSKTEEADIQDESATHPSDKIPPPESPEAADPQRKASTKNETPLTGEDRERQSDSSDLPPEAPLSTAAKGESPLEKEETPVTEDTAPKKRPAERKSSDTEPTEEPLRPEAPTFRPEAFESQPVGTVYYVRHAGVVIVHAFLSTYFKAIGLVEENGEFRDEVSRHQAVNLIEYLATGRIELPEYELVLPKFLCNLPLDLPLDRQGEIPEDMLAEGEALLRAVIQHWGAIGDASTTALREGFLSREGKLERRANGWTLTIEKRTMDILLNRLKWNISIVKLPWMKEMLKVEWNY